MKEQIIITAANIFRKNGIRNVSIDEICTEIRISKKTFYAHFSGKEDLIVAVINFVHSDLKTQCEKNFDNTDNVIDTLILFISEIRKDMDARPYLFWKDIAKYYPKIYENYAAVWYSAMRESFEIYLRMGIEEGYFRKDLDVELTAFFHSFLLKNSSTEQIQGNRSKFSKKRLMNFYINLMMCLIVNEKGMKYIENKIENYGHDCIRHPKTVKNKN